MISQKSVLTLFIFVMISINNQLLFGQSAEPLEVYKTEDFTISGDGEASNWSRAEWTQIPQRDIKPDENELNTRMKVLYSDTGIYFFFESEDQVLNATMDADFMKLWKEDVVEVFLWPDTSSSVYFEYEISPLNYELPILISNEDGDLVRWRPFMYEEDRKTRRKTSVKGGEKKSGSSITSWTAEFFIPFKLLRPLGNINPKPGTKWRGNFYRVDYDDGATTFEWKEVDQTFHEFEEYGTILFE